MTKEQNDNTRVAEPIIERRIKLTPEQLQMIQYRKLQEAAKRNQAYISNGYYKNLQNFYNNNFFGYGGNELLIQIYKDLDLLMDVK